MSRPNADCRIRLNPTSPSPAWWAAATNGLPVRDALRPVLFVRGEVPLSAAEAGTEDAAARFHLTVQRRQHLQLVSERAR